MKRYDLEAFLEEIHQLLLRDLNTKITDLNAEKADAIVLKTIDPDAYILQTLNGEMANWDPLIVYGVDDIETTANGPDVSSRYSVSVIVLVADTGEDIQIGNRMFRYLRALEELFHANWNNFGVGGARLEISSKVPVPLTDMNTTQKFRAVGVAIQASIS